MGGISCSELRVSRRKLKKEGEMGDSRVDRKKKERGEEGIGG